MTLTADEVYEAFEAVRRREPEPDLRVLHPTEYDALMTFLAQNERFLTLFEDERLRAAFEAGFSARSKGRAKRGRVEDAWHEWCEAQSKRVEI